MVKRIMFSLVAFLVATIGFAQDIVPVATPEESVPEVSSSVVPKPVALSIGPKVGINYSLAGEPGNLNSGIGVGGNLGFNGGIAFNMRFVKRPLTKYADTGRFGVQLEAMYALHSIKTDADNIQMNTVEIPLLLQWWFLRDLCIEVGPTFLAALSTSPDELQVGNQVYRTGDIRGNDVMLTVGIEYKSQKGFTASLRYNQGCSGLASNFNTTVSTISIGIGWLFSVMK